MERGIIAADRGILAKGPTVNSKRAWWSYWPVRVVLAIIALILFAGIVTGIAQALNIT
ncbi:hypothetical protein ACIBQ6_22170 [Nonomuraea sp. NPDC049655]|uniref:hypothetical protein n=1 Tax=Nonomuraea sp. NPDC049655 TaxID=3364355 RepID=UPI00379684E8